MKLWQHATTTAVFPGLSYVVLVMGMTWPAITHLSERLIGNNIDNWIFYWNNWWVGQALTNGRSWYETSFLFYPQGTSLIAHSHSLLNSFLAALLEPLTGPVAAFNLVFLLGLWLSAVGMFWLVRHLTNSTPAAWLAGLVFAFAPYHLTQALTHVHLGAIQWWPFYALLWCRLLRQPRWQTAVLTGLLAALTLWSGWQLAILLALWTLLWLGWQTAVGPGSPGLQRLPWRQVGLVGLVAVLLCLPILWPIFTHWSEVTTAAALDEGLSKQTDLLAYGVPPTYHPLWGDTVQPIYERFVANRSSMAYVGAAALLLVGVAAWRAWSQARFWLLSGGVWLLLAAGSAPRWNGQVYESIRLPYAWVNHLFPLSAVRAPDRFNLLLLFSLSVLVGIGAAYLIQQRSWVFWPLAGVIILEYLAVPLPMWTLPPDSPVLAELAQEVQTAVIDYPMGYTESKQWLYYQTRHQRPIVEGHVSRYTPETYAFIAQDPILRALYQVGEWPAYVPPAIFAPPDLPLAALGPALRRLREANLNTVLLHRSYTDAAQLAHFQQVLPLLPVYQDEAVAVYDLAQPRPWQYGEAPVELAPHLSLLLARPQMEEAAVSLYLLAQSTGEGDPLPCQVQLAQAETAVTFLAAGAAWQPGDLDSQQVHLPLPPTLTPGTYAWELLCAPGTAYTLPDQLVVLPSGQRTLLRRQTHIDYEDKIELYGYQWQTQGTTLFLRLAWLALADITADYKVFVHLLDDNGTLVRQYDAVPCQWTCPTSQWLAHQLITDDAPLSLWDLPPGSYQLAVGLYEAQTGSRLMAQTAKGQVIPEAYFILPEPFVIQVLEEMGTNQ